MSGSVVKTFTLMDKKWKLRFVNTLGKDAVLGDIWGKCYFKERIIRISRQCPKEKILEVIIHECTHGASNDMLSEEFVDESAGDIAKLLTRMGYNSGCTTR